MLKSIAVLCFLSFPLFPAEYHYDLQMTFKRGPTSQDPRAHTVLNNKEVFCSCGKPPVFVMFFYGDPEYYCASHIPEIEYVRPVSAQDVDSLLKSLTNNMNGAHCGVESHDKK